MSTLEALEQAAYGPRNETSPPTALDQESNVAALVNQLFHVAREARRGQMSVWKRNYRTLNNRQYQPKNEPWDEQPAVNNIWPAVASSVAWLTDQRPITEVTPIMPPFSPYADFYQGLATDMNTALSSSFLTHGLESEVTKVWWDVYTYGIGYYKNTWEAHLADGLGDAVFRRTDPFTVFPDPHARSEDQLNYIIEARQMTVADAERAWPGAAKKLGYQFVDDRLETAPHVLDDSVNDRQPRVALAALTPGGATPGPIGSGSKTTDMPVVTVLEAYVRGTLFTDGETKGTKKVQDDWRCVIVAGDRVLMDESCWDMNAYGTHPYSRQVLYDTGEWYGPCITEFLVPVQRTINWLLGSLLRNIYLMGNPVLLESPRAVSRNRKFTNRPGARIEAGNHEASWLNPPQMQGQYAGEVLGLFKGEIETITGLSAMVRGFAPTGRNAQGVLDSVQDAAFVRVRASLRESERALRSVTGKMAATIAEFYTEPRLMSLVGPDGKRTHQSFRARHFYAQNAEDMTERIPMRFTLIADAGSQLLTSKQARANQSIELFKLGAIDVYEVLKAQQWPNAAYVAQRVMQMMATQPDKKK